MNEATSSKLQYIKFVMDGSPSPLGGKLDNQDLVKAAGADSVKSHEGDTEINIPTWLAKGTVLAKPEVQAVSGLLQSS